MARADWSSPAIKGHPDTAAIRRMFAVETKRALETRSISEAVKAARSLAAMEMRDGETFGVYIKLVALANAEALQRLGEYLSRYVVLHITCWPRVNRAKVSATSFAEAQALGVSQLTVVGSAEKELFDFDARTGILTVPECDSYEQLPAKVVSAMFLLALAGSVEAVLKVDDDHRLVNAKQLVDTFGTLPRKCPALSGHVIDIGTLGANARTWHFGKTRDPALARTPYTLPGTTKYVEGGKGYFINSQGLKLLAWSYVYFERYLATSLAEDVTVSDLIERQGGRVIPTNMKRIIRTVDEY